MHSSIATAGAVFAAIAAIPAVSAHGYVANAIIGGKTEVVGGPNWIYTNPKPDQPGWYAYNQDNGFVEPAAYGTDNITCHKGATPGTTSLTVAAGATIGMQWNTWPDSHKGPVINMLANCNGPCASVKKDNLKFFAIQDKGLIDGSTEPGTWATDDLIKNDFTGDVKIPSNLAPGNYVLRHEIIALHSAGNADGAQNYPMCVNIKVTGSGAMHPCNKGADCRLGTKLYKENDAGILISIYSALTSYAMPGPKVFSGLKKRMAFEA